MTLRAFRGPFDDLLRTRGPLRGHVRVERNLCNNFQVD